MANLFGDSMWTKLAANPTTREYLNDPSFVQKLNMLKSDPNALGNMASDPRLSAALGVILGLGAEGFSTVNPDADTPMRDAPAPEKKAEPVAEPEEEEEVDEELEAERAQKRAAVAEKDKGNAFYKQRKFDEALACYDRAIELDPDNFAFYTNKAAVFFEQKDYDNCIETCE